MAKMTVMWLTMYAICFFGAFVNPIFGVLGYLFEYYLRPSLNWWGAAIPDWRWNFTIAGVLTLTYFMRRSSLPDIGPARKGPGTCLVGLLLVMLLVYPIAVNKPLSWGKTVEYSKFILFHGLVVGTVRSELAFDAVVAAHIAGSAWWGWQAYQNPKRTAGRLANVGSGDSRGDNGAAAHMITVIPLAVAYLLLHRDRRMRGLCLVALPLVINAVILCNSRGSTVALTVAGCVAAFMVRSGHRLRTIAGIVVLALSFLFLADPQFIQRQLNSDYSDGSSQGRLEAWRGAAQLIADHPLGTGGQGFWWLSPEYAAELVNSLGERRDPHNTYVLVASEWGIIGLCLFVGYYAWCWKLLREVKKRAEGGDIWYYRAVALQLGLLGFLIAAIFVDRLYAEAGYWLGAFAVSLNRLQTHKLAATAEAKEPDPVRVAPAMGPLPRPV